MRENRLGTYRRLPRGCQEPKRRNGDCSAHLIIRDDYSIKSEMLAKILCDRQTYKLNLHQAGYARMASTGVIIPQFVRIRRIVAGAPRLVRCWAFLFC